jgi:hypothetical protein
MKHIVQRVDHEKTKKTVVYKMHHVVATSIHSFIQSITRERRTRAAGHQGRHHHHALLTKQTHRSRVRQYCQMGGKGNAGNTMGPLATIVSAIREGGLTAGYHTFRPVVVSSLWLSKTFPPSLLPNIDQHHCFEPVRCRCPGRLYSSS